MNKTAIYLVPYHSEPGLHLNGASGQFAVVEKAIAAGEWPYDNGDDPSFYVARKGGPLTWGVCRQDVRNAMKPGSVVVFFSFTAQNRSVLYRLSAVATVADKLDRPAFYKDVRFREHRDLYLNVLVRPMTGGWEYDESDRERKARHSDWLWRIAVHGREKQPFQVRHKKTYKAGQFNRSEVPLAKNYIVFSAAGDETCIPPAPPQVATATRGRHEKWTDEELRSLTIDVAGAMTRNGRNHLRTTNRSGRNLHPEIRFDLPSDQARAWRRNLISVLMKGN